MLFTVFRHTTHYTHSKHAQTHTLCTTAHTRQEEREKERRGCCSTQPMQCMCVWSELRARMEGLKQQASSGALQSRTPLVKSQTLGRPPIRPPDGVSCGSSAVFPPTCSLGTLLTFQWQGYLLCIVLTSHAGTTKQTCTTGTYWAEDTNWWTLHTPSVPQNSSTTHSHLLCSCCD